MRFTEEVHMDILHLSDQLGESATPVAWLIKDTTIWAGRYIQSGFSDTLVPSITYLWTLAVQTGYTTIQFMYAGAAASLTVAGTLFAISCTAFKMSESHIYQENLCAKAAWKSIGLAALIASTAATTFSIIMITA